MSYTDKMLRDDALKGKVIVVTGGGSLGKAMTKYFLELGAQVAITSRDIEKQKILLQNWKRKQVEHAYRFNVMFVIMKKWKICYKKF
jgi:NAD(P)-dependent dehydrogenase (short-subunit alcohol dehydrogenase family)